MLLPAPLNTHRIRRDRLKHTIKRRPPQYGVIDKPSFRHNNNTGNVSVVQYCLPRMISVQLQCSTLSERFLLLMFREVVWINGACVKKLRVTTILTIYSYYIINNIAYQTFTISQY